MNKEKVGACRIYILGKIKTTAPFHIGSGEFKSREGGNDTDSPVKLNSDNKPYIPATSIGGLLRGTAENLVSVLYYWDISDVWNLFGEACQDDDKSNKNNLHPSRLRIRNAALTEKWDEQISIRDGVGIDRKSASARSVALYDYEIVPAGSEFSLFLELRDAETRDKQLLTLVIEALRQIPKGIGGKVKNGLGAFNLCIDKVVEIDLSDNKDLYKFLSQKNNHNPCKDENLITWDEWRKSNIPDDIIVKSDKNKLPACVPQAVTFTYRFTVDDPLLINGQDSPEGALEDYIKRGKFNTEDDTKGIDASWISAGTDPSCRDTWKPIVPGSSLRGVFRNHCERILRTLSLEYARQNISKKPDDLSDKSEIEKAIKEEYKRIVSASDPLEDNKSNYLRSSGFYMQDEIKRLWNEKKQDEGDKPEKRYEDGREIASYIWCKSDLGEQMWGSSQWASRVIVSEGALTEDWKDKWKEMLFQNVAINRFTGGASDKKLFNALALTDAEFEGKITVFGDVPWMLGLIALLFKDLQDGYVRIGSGKSRGRGKIKACLTNIEVKAIQGSQIAGLITASENNIWQTFCWKKEDEDYRNIDLLKKGVCELQCEVKKYERYECRKAEGGIACASQ